MRGFERVLSEVEIIPDASATRGDALYMGRLDCVIVATRSALRQTASVSKIWT
jgi:hypothetical protein